MTALPLTDWQASLDEMDCALAAALAVLDRYQNGWQQLLTDHAAAGDRANQSTTLDGIEARLHDWDARLVAAEELAASVERQLTERESTVAGWRQAFNEWKELIQREENPEAALEAGWGVFTCPRLP